MPTSRTTRSTGSGSPVAAQTPRRTFASSTRCSRAGSSTPRARICAAGCRSFRAWKSRHIHAPWEAPQAALAAAGVRLGETYPLPIVELARARAEALAAYRALPARRGDRQARLGRRAQ
ncbi:MAG: FAD-binding domain-containing protein [Burkholderiales bacterium]|nr:FAD-binding domain-containing protein [Burkholderiales bacterium]